MSVQLRACLLGCLLVLMPAALVRAQTGTVAGEVREASGAPIPGANVVVEGTGRGAAADAEGRFTIAGLPPGRYSVTASAVGFVRASLQAEVGAGETAALRFVLAEATLTSGEVVVTAARRAQEADRVPVSLSVVTPRELETRAAVSLDEALRYVPGVQLTENQVNVRGSSGFSFNTGSRVLLLVDGMPLMGPDRESIPFDALPLSQVARIEVFKGPGSALYGGGALGGVINVITKDFPDAPETAVRAFAGGYFPTRHAVWRAQWEGGDAFRPLGGLSLTHARRTGEHFGFWVNGFYRADAGYTNFNATSDFRLFTKVGWRPTPALRLDVLAGLTGGDSDSFLYWNGLRDPLNPGRLSFGTLNTTGTNDNRTNELALLPSLTHVLSSRLFYTLRGRLFGVLIRPLDDDGRPRPVDEGTLGARYGGEAQLDLNPRPGRYLTAGLTADALATQSSFFLDEAGQVQVRSQPEAALFGQWEEQRGALSLTGGLRFDAYWVDAATAATKLSPKVNAAYALRAWTLRAAFGQGFRVPGVAERFVNTQAFLPLIPNLDLLPEESTGYEIGVRGPLALGGLTLRADAAAFWTDYARLVEPKFVARAQSFQFVNLTRARVRGAEASAEARAGALTARLAYTFLDADDLTDARALAFRSRHLVQLAAGARLRPWLEAGLDYRYASRFERVDTDFARFVLDAETAVSTRVLDLRLSLGGERLQATFLLKNALDYYYVERPALLAPPRHLVVQVQAAF